VASWLVIVLKMLFTWLPRLLRAEMATREMKAKMSAYSTRV
jgi:hypothetical protein